MHYEIIETPRLLLRKLTPADYIYLFEHKTVGEIMTFLGHQNEEEFLKEKFKYENGYTTYRSTFVLFQMIDKESQKVIGGCSLHNWFPEHRRAEIGYGIFDDAHKNLGLMTEAVTETIAFGFEKMNLNRIEAYVAPYNIPSLKLMEKFSFTQEGLLREHYFSNGKLDDSVVFSLLRKETGN
jgi:ribosomal-protein-alanine N-acetyltransferase